MAKQTTSAKGITSAKRSTSKKAAPKQTAKKNSAKHGGTPALKPGDKVEWGTSQGKTKGVVKKKVTGSTKVQGHEVKASKDAPQFLVESDKTGKKAAHKVKALKKVEG
jgi:hypothetical protein